MADHREALAVALCNQFQGTIHNQSTDWDHEDEGTRDWWREQATTLLGSVAETFAAAQRYAEYERDDALRAVARANDRLTQMKAAHSE